MLGALLKKYLEFESIFLMDFRKISREHLQHSLMRGVLDLWWMRRAM
jgi:hypothetical protein